MTYEPMNTVYVSRDDWMDMYCTLQAQILLDNRHLTIDAVRELARIALRNISYKDDGRASEHEAA